MASSAVFDKVRIACTWSRHNVLAHTLSTFIVRNNIMVRFHALLHLYRSPVLELLPPARKGSWIHAYLNRSSPAFLTHQVTSRQDCQTNERLQGGWAGANENVELASFLFYDHHFYISVTTRQEDTGLEFVLWNLSNMRSSVSARFYTSHLLEGANL